MRYFFQECILGNRHPAQSGQHRNVQSDRSKARRDIAPGSSGLRGTTLAWRENATPSAKDHAWCRNA
jgi:hypothetical protein